MCMLSKNLPKRWVVRLSIYMLIYEFRLVFQSGRWSTLTLTESIFCPYINMVALRCYTNARLWQRQGLDGWVSLAVSCLGTVTILMAYFTRLDLHISLAVDKDDLIPITKRDEKKVVSYMTLSHSDNF